MGYCRGTSLTAGVPLDGIKDSSARAIQCQFRKDENAGFCDSTSKDMSTTSCRFLFRSPAFADHLARPAESLR